MRESQVTVLAADQGQEDPGEEVVTIAGAAAGVDGQLITRGDTVTRAESGLSPGVRTSSMDPRSPWAGLTLADRGREPTVRARR